jgi:hypothetical protein
MGLRIVRRTGRRFRRKGSQTVLNYREVVDTMQLGDCHLLHDRERNTVRLFSNHLGARNGGGSEGETDTATVDKLLVDGLVTRRERGLNEGPGYYRYDLTEKGKTRKK